MHGYLQVGVRHYGGASNVFIEALLQDSLPPLLAALPRDLAELPSPAATAPAVSWSSNCGGGGGEGGEGGGHASTGNSSGNDGSGSALHVSVQLTRTLSLLAECTQPEHIQRALSALVSGMAEAGAGADAITTLWAAGLLDVETQYDKELAVRLARWLWPQLAAAEASAASITSALVAPAASVATLTATTFWCRLEACPEVVSSEAFHPDTLATLAIRAHRTGDDDPRKQTCTLLTELIKRFPECALMPTRVEVDAALEADSSLPFAVLNVAVEYLNCAAVDVLLALDPPASFLTLDGIELCSAVGAAIAQLKAIEDKSIKMNVFLALGRIVTAFAKRASALMPPHDWADIRNPIVSTVEVLHTRFQKQKDKVAVITPWQRLLDLWPETPAEVERQRVPLSILPLLSVAPTIVATTTAAISASLTSAALALPPSHARGQGRGRGGRGRVFFEAAGVMLEPVPPPRSSLVDDAPLLPSRLASMSTGSSIAGASAEHSAADVQGETGNPQDITLQLRKMGFGLASKPCVTERFHATESSFLFHATWKNGMAVVVKQLNPGSVASADEFAEMHHKRYWQEFSFHRSLNHPNIVRLLDCYWNEGGNESGIQQTEGVWSRSLHLVFPYYPLGSLGDVLKTFRFFDPKTCKRLRPEHEAHAFFFHRVAEGGVVHTCSPQFIHSTLLQIARALDFLHYQDTGLSHVIHRDIKTENILLEAQPNGTYVAKLTDFGLARHYDRSTRTPGLKCTMQISAPEMLRTPPKYDLKVDIYAYGHLIWEVLSLLKPFSNLKNGDELANTIREWNHSKDKLDEVDQDLKEQCEDIKGAGNVSEVLLPEMVKDSLARCRTRHGKKKDKLLSDFKTAGDEARPSPLTPPLPHYLATSELGTQLVRLMHRCLDFDPTKRPSVSKIKDLLESGWKLNTPELWSAPERSVFLERLGELVRRQFAFQNPYEDYSNFMRTLAKNNGLLTRYCSEVDGKACLLPKLPDEPEAAFHSAARACERTMVVPQQWVANTTTGAPPKYERLSEMLVCVRNLVAHCEEKAYLHEIGWSKARLRYELGNRFAALAVSLALELQKVQAEQGENDVLEDTHSSNAYQLAVESVMTMRLSGDTLSS